MSQRIVRIVVRGRVQGVGFRAFVAREAGRRGVSGWVRNCRDGAVEAVFEGNETGVEEMLAQCRRGPIAARVDAWDVREAGAEALKEAGAAAGQFLVAETF